METILNVGHKDLIFFKQLEVDYIIFNEPFMNSSNTTVDSSNVMAINSVAKKNLKRIT